jgi:glycosyltransferase involved in cell wall biosynthesis
MMVDGKTGFLVEKGDPNQLVDKLSLLIEDEKLAKKMGDSGRKFVEETFNWELITKNFIKIAKSYLEVKKE